MTGVAYRPQMMLPFRLVPLYHFTKTLTVEAAPILGVHGNGTYWRPEYEPGLQAAEGVGLGCGVDG